MIEVNEQTRLAAVALGSLMLSSSEPLAVSPLIVEYLESRDAQRAQRLKQAGIAAETVDEFSGLLPRAPDDLALAAALGCFWALGHRASPPAPARWFSVVSGTDLDRDTFARRTGETLIGIISGSTSTIHAFSAYVDARGLRSLAPALASATTRGVVVTVAAIRRLERDDAMAALAGEIAAHGDASKLHLHSLEGMEWFPHLKVVAVDGRSAYIGSANLTYAGLTSNFEVGALVEGTGVIAYEALIEELIGRATSAAQIGEAEPAE